MDNKDWIIIGLLLLAFGGPLGVHIWHQRQRTPRVAVSNVGGRGPLADTVPGAPAIDDGRRIGAAIGTVGGRAFTEGAKAGVTGGKAYGSRQHHHEHLQLGGAV